MGFGVDFGGAHGGELAIAFGTGCAAGYAFCLRTVHKMLQAHADKEHSTCLQRIEKLENDKGKLEERVHLLEERLVMGAIRQREQLSDSSIRILGEDKLGGH